MAHSGFWKHIVYKNQLIGILDVSRKCCWYGYDKIVNDFVNQISVKLHISLKRIEYVVFLVQIIIAKPQNDHMNMKELNQYFPEQFCE